MDREMYRKMMSAVEEVWGCSAYREAPAVKSKREVLTDLYNSTDRTRDWYKDCCDCVYSLYPEFRNMWMNSNGIARKMWQKYYSIEEWNGRDKDYLLNQPQYFYWLDGIRNAYFSDFSYYVSDQKRKFSSIKRFYVGPGPEIEMDTKEIECACDFFDSIYRSGFFKKFPYPTNITAEMLFKIYKGE